MPTAVLGSRGPGPLHVALCAEYDALPGVGHACGHNVICAAALGAGLALAPVVERLGLRVSVLGTPAEEGGGGKIGFIEAGLLRRRPCRADDPSVARATWRSPTSSPCSS